MFGGLCLEGRGLCLEGGGLCLEGGGLYLEGTGLCLKACVWWVAAALYRVWLPLIPSEHT